MNGNPMQMGNMLKVELALDARYFRNPNDAAEGCQVWVGHVDEGRACFSMKLCVCVRVIFYLLCRYTQPEGPCQRWQFFNMAIPCPRPT